MGTIAHLKYVSEVLGLDIKEGLKGLGSTWFGDTGLMVASARLTIDTRGFKFQKLG